MKSVEGRARKACATYNLIEDGDRIAVAVSGGKDSVAMAVAMVRLKRYHGRDFSLHAIMLDPRFENRDTDYSPLERYFDSIGLPYTIKRTNIADVVFGIRDEKNPCSLCARLRRGSLHDLCLELGCNKIALGHHKNDAVETLFLNLFHEGRLAAFAPKSYLSRKNITMIRPLILCEEAEISRAVSREQLPIVKNPCPKDGVTQREIIKEFIREKEKEYPGFLNRTFHAMQAAGLNGL